MGRNGAREGEEEKIAQKDIKREKTDRRRKKE